MKAKGFLSRFSVRYRYVFSFLLVALIPIGVILVFFYHYNVGELKKDVDFININRVSQIEAGIEAELYKQYSLAGALNENPRFLPLATQGTQGSRYEAMLIYNQYMSYRDLNTATAVLFLDTDEAYTKTGVSSCSAYFTSILGIDLTQADLLLTTLSKRLSGVSSAFLPVTRKDGKLFLACAYAIPGYKSEPNVILLSGIDETKMLELFDPLLSRFSGSVFVLNNQREMVFHMEKKSGVTDPIREAILQADYEMENNILPVKAWGQNFSIIYSRSARTGLTYGVIAKEDTTITQVVKQTTLVWQMALLALVICVVVIVFLTLFNYLPIKKLLALTGRPSRAFDDEYHQIREALIDNSTKAERLEAALDQQRPFVLERLLDYALYSETTPEQIKQLFSNLDIRFDHPCTFVMCVKAIRNHSDKRGYSYFKTVVIDTVGAMRSTNAAYFTVERSGEDELIIAVNCEETVSEASCAEELRRRVTELLGGEYLFTIGVGSVQRKTEDLKTSLYEASMLVLNHPEHPVSYLADLERAPESLGNLYPAKDVLLFQLQLRQGDESNARKTFLSLYELAQDGSRSLLISKYLYSYIVNAIAEVVQQAGKGDFSVQLRKLMLYKTPENFVEAAGALIEDFCRFVNDNKRSSNSVLRDRILQYIKENLSDVNLGLENIGEAFDLSPYYISRFFRDQNNVNLKDYIYQMRLAMAKELLTSTELAVSEIVSAIGYLSVSSFIRKFKATEGITPGEYRERVGGSH